MNGNEKQFITALTCYHLQLARSHGPFAQRHMERAEVFRNIMEPPRVVPDRRPEVAEGLALALTEGGSTWSTTEPHGIFRWTIRSELMALPEAMKERIASAREVHLDIDSPGGDAVATIAILRALEGKRVNVSVRYAASAAAILVACVNGHRSIASDGGLLIHEPAQGALGGREEHRQAIKLIDAAVDYFVPLMAERTRQPTATIEEWFKDGDHHFSAEQALAYGLVDSISDSSVAVGCLVSRAGASLGAPAHSG